MVRARSRGAVHGGTLVTYGEKRAAPILGLAAKTPDVPLLCRGRRVERFHACAVVVYRLRIGAFFGASLDGVMPLAYRIRDAQRIAEIKFLGASAVLSDTSCRRRCYAFNDFKEHGKRTDPLPLPVKIRRA
jgi:hypothetical protein